MIKIQIDNADAIQNALNAFENKIAKKVVRQGVRAVWKPLLDRAKANARTAVGGNMGKLIAKNLQVRAFRRQKKGAYGVYVRVRPNVPEFVSYAKGSFSSLANRKTTGQRAYIPVAIEYGHAFPYRGGGKNPPKDVAARPFMRLALDVILPNAPKRFERYLINAINAENLKK